MLIYLYDGSYFGLLSSIFYSYEKKQTPNKVTSGYITPPFLSKIVEIKTDKDKAIRVEKKIKEILSYHSFIRLKYAFCSNAQNKGDIIFAYLKKIIDSNFDLSDNFKDGDIYSFKQIADKVGTEIHRFKGFVRFEQTVSGIYYSKIMPDNDICEFLLPHFASRYKAMPFIIHDLKRNVYAVHNEDKNAVIKGDFKDIQEFLKSNDEVKYLFKKYYDTVNIKERKNLKLMKNYMPTRYHKFMPEKTLFDK